MEYIGVLDCNNFFASCERLFRPDLKSRPVVVLSSNDGCVVARSQEIKDMGIPMGVPYFQVKDILKKAHATVFSSHFTLYRDISTRVFLVVKDNLELMEQYSIDEAFFTFQADSPEAAAGAMRSLKQIVERSVGIPISIGLAATKTQAKYANRLAKKADGVTVLTAPLWAEVVGTLPLHDIWGVGGRLSRRFREAGITTVAQLLQCPKPRLGTLFGVTGLHLQAELAGQVQYAVTRDHEPKKSIVSSRSFSETISDAVILKDAVAYHVRQVVSDLRHHRLQTRCVRVTLQTSRYGDYSVRGGSEETVFGEPTSDSGVIMTAALKLAERLYEVDVPYKKAAVQLSGLTSNQVVQGSLFETVTPGQTGEVLLTTIDSLNAKFGRDTLQLGRQTQAATWQSKRESLSPPYTTQWSALPTVRAL